MTGAREARRLCLLIIIGMIIGAGERLVRAIAEIEHRPYEDQLRFLIVLGLEQTVQSWRNVICGKNVQFLETLREALGGKL